MKQLFSIAIFLILGFAVFCQEAVDLGLSVKWATCNVGASKPEEYGKYYTFKKAKKLSSSNWRVPTIEEFEELWKYCNYKWTTRNGVEGSLFTSKINGYSIFLPAGGLRYDSDMYSVGCSGNYWSSSTYLRYYAYYMKFYGDHAQKGNITLYYGFSVRLVQDVK